MSRAVLCMGGDPHIPFAVHHQVVNHLLTETVGLELNETVFLLVIECQTAGCTDP